MKAPRALASQQSRMGWRVVGLRRLGNGKGAITMGRRQNIGHVLVEGIKWLIPATCVICRRQHNAARAICADCEHGFSRNRHACYRCALPLQLIDSPTVSRLDFECVAERALCPACLDQPSEVVCSHAPYLMRTGIRDLIHLWKFQNRPHLSPLLADLLVESLPAACQNSSDPEYAESQRMLVPIPTQWRRQVSRGFDHTWLLAQAIRTRRAEPMVVRS